MTVGFEGPAWLEAAQGPVAAGPGPGGPPGQGPRRRGRGSGGSAPLWVGLRSGLVAHRSPWIRLAPWLLLVAVAFGLAFAPLMLAPEVERWLVLRARVGEAWQAAVEAQGAAAGLRQVASQLPGLREQVQQAEEGLVSVEDLPGVVTRLQTQAAAAGVRLSSVVFGPYQPVRSPAGQDGESPGAAGGNSGQPAGTASGDSATPQPGSSSPPADAAYGTVTVEVVAQGDWLQLADFAGEIARQEAIRIQGWSAARGSEGVPYDLRLVGELVVKGQPPVAVAVQGEEPAQ
ncbi:hypothetical protein DYI95_003225 [Thermaerobacter sp. PB12/4term]|uniref:hypothetical protein n=1 Tax=Thermaerobacter sp. PB12/4term TaxID=2293838 RepID=UPI000E32AB54|nr:hypothetical protein [Thermaerobacter sp. PB12/4term]QIA26668.1 hypothetical protein DYI95_003225 [Thermaerobacter sp. PB12/4term]